MDVDDPSRRRAQKGVHRGFERRIPVQNVVMGRVRRRQTDVSIGVGLLIPFWAIPWKGAIDDVGDAAVTDEAWGENGPWTDEDSRMEVGRRLAKIVWNRSQHLPLSDILSFNDRTQEPLLLQLHTSPR